MSQQAQVRPGRMSFWFLNTKSNSSQQYELRIGEQYLMVRVVSILSNIASISGRSELPEGPSNEKSGSKAWPASHARQETGN